MEQPSSLVLTEPERQLCENIRELMRSRRMKQVDLANALGRSQPWVSKRMSENPDSKNKWKVEDLEALQQVFSLAPWELLQPGHGRLDRRKTGSRRTGLERRTSRALEARVVAAYSSPLEATIAQTEDVISEANRLYELAERIRTLSRSLLARHTAALSHLPADGALAGETPGRETGRTHTKKTG